MDLKEVQAKAQKYYDDSVAELTKYYSSNGYTQREAVKMAERELISAYQFLHFLYGLR